MRNGKEFMSHLDGLLKEAKITRAQLLRDIGAAKSLFSMCEKRGNLPPTKAVYNISKRMHVSMESLLEDAAAEQPTDITRIVSMLSQLPPESRHVIELMIKASYDDEMQKIK